jgi:Holliday junction resolvase RusA-like endonuclease
MGVVHKPPVFVPVNMTENSIKLIYAGNPSVNKIYNRKSTKQEVFVKAHHYKSNRFIINFFKRNQKNVKRFEKYAFTYKFKYKDNRRRDISNYIKIIEDLIFEYLLNDNDAKVYQIKIIKEIDKNLEANELEITWDEALEPPDFVSPNKEEIEKIKDVNNTFTYKRNVKNRSKKILGVYDYTSNSISFYFNVNMSVNFIYRNRRGFEKPIPVYKSYTEKLERQIAGRFQDVRPSKYDKYKFNYYFCFNTKRKRDISNYIKAFEDYVFNNILKDDDSKVYEINIYKKIESQLPYNYLLMTWEQM